MNDLVLKGGRVIDPSQGLDKVTDIAFAGGKVAAIGDNLSGADTRDIKGRILSPGLIDLHTHVYWGGTSLGVEAELLARTGGVTTSIDAGSAGPGNFHGFRKHVIEPCPVRILPFLNVSFAGIFAFSKTVMVGECQDMRLIDARDAVRVAREHKDLILGIKVRVGKSASGDSGIMPLDIAMDVAEETGLPLMAHLDAPPPSRHEVMKARQRGVIFDIGHGGGSFGFGTTRGMLKAGFLPDVISSDVHVISIEGPAFDLLTTMSKFLCLGVDLPTVIKLATSNAATAINRSDIGTLKVGSVGEATVIELKDGTFDYADSIGEKMIGDKRMVSAGVVLAGKWWHPA